MSALHNRIQITFKPLLGQRIIEPEIFSIQDELKVFLLI